MIAIKTEGAYIHKQGETQYVIVKNNSVVFGPNKSFAFTSSRNADIGGSVVEALLHKPIIDTGLKEYGSPFVEINNVYVLYTYPVVSKSETDCNECLCCRARGVRDGLVDKIQSMIDNWSRKISVATRAAEDTTSLETQLAELEDFQQALCDVPQQPGFPNDFSWPTVPLSWQNVDVSGVNVAEYYNGKISTWSEPQE